MATLHIPIPFSLVRDNNAWDFLRLILLLAVRDRINRVEISRDGDEVALRGWREDTVVDWVPPPRHLIDALAVEMEQLKSWPTRWLLRLGRCLPGGKKLNRQGMFQISMGAVAVPAAYRIIVVGERALVSIEMNPGFQQAELARDTLNRWMESKRDVGLGRD